MRESQAKSILLKDYTPPAFLIDRISLDVDIRTDDAIVKASLAVRRNPASKETDAALELDGQALEFISLLLDGKEFPHKTTGETLTVADVPASFTLETVTRIVPQKNATLEGLYAAKSGFVTQCEAQGFRRITWFLDRPDNLAVYTVTVHADRAKYPVLLSNGNRIGSGVIGDRHWAKFEDPYPKPSYLFALVAADLEVIAESIVTRSGKTKKLSVYVEPGQLDQAAWSMDCLKRAIVWDEKRFDLELDLEEFKIVAVGDFSSGAMENKGLNIFNAKYVLARPDTATDTDYLNIDRVVAHEYFHNWTGNRVTCRDWFQLSLKEGLTVFRDQEYGADTYSRGVARIQEVRGLRAGQFAEDAGPMAHPVRPQSYQAVQNFYTMTVYEKGAEVVRMQHTLLGEKKFQDGMKLYFKRHDGQAVTCDDFVAAMQDASGVDLAQFKRWYDVAGTPVLDCSGTYSNQVFTLTVKQSMHPPFHVPLAVKIGQHEKVLSVTGTEQSYTFENLKAKPVPSLLRGFSAPVTLNYPYTEAELVHLLAHDDDPFNRWEAGQRLSSEIILHRNGVPSPAFLDAIKLLLKEKDPAFVAETLALPSETFLAEQMKVVDPDALHGARNALRRALASHFTDSFLEVYEKLKSDNPYSPDSASAGRRALRNLCLGYLGEIEGPALAYRQFERADNMTDAMAALASLANTDCAERGLALEAFYAKWQGDQLVVDKWLAVQASSRLHGTLARVRELLAHPAFDLKVPNKVYALIRSFSVNHVRFHSADGAGYEFVADQVLALDKFIPQVAARIARGFDRWKRFDLNRKNKSKAQLERIRDAAGLSKDVAEIVGKALA